MRKKKLTRILAIAILAQAITLSMCSCSTEQSTKREILFTYDGNAASFDEAQIYVEAIKLNYAPYYGSTAWDQEMDTGNGKQTLADIVKNEAIGQLKMAKVMKAKAKEFGLKLTENEKQQAKNSAKDFIEQIGGEERLKELQLVAETVEAVFADNNLADKVYQKVTEEAKIEIDKKEYETKTFYDAVFTFVTYDENFKEKKASKKKKEALKKEAEELAEAAKKEDLHKLAEKSDNCYVSNLSFCNATMEETDKILVEAANKLTSENDTTSVIETKTEFHVIQLIKLNDETASEENYLTALEAKKGEYFSKVYQEWVKKAEKNWSMEKSVDQHLYDEFNFDVNDTTENSEEGSTIEIEDLPTPETSSKTNGSE